jgi:hypothetical protein
MTAPHIRRELATCQERIDYTRRILDGEIVRRQELIRLAVEHGERPADIHRAIGVDALSHQRVSQMVAIARHDIG